MPRGLALDLKEGRMYWTEDGTMKLRSSTLDGQDLRDVIVKTEVQEGPRDIAVDVTTRKVYWTALCGLRRANLDGSNEEAVSSADFASGVAICNGSVFWADWMHGQIFRRDMTNSGTEERIVTGLASPVGIAVDPFNPHIYWSDIGIARTQRAYPDGSHIQLLNMSWAIMNTYGMAVDARLAKLYMTDFEKTGMSMPYGIAVDPPANRVYWTDFKAGRIQRLSLRCASGLLEVEHGEALHGSSIRVSCPAGYNGTVTLSCRDSRFDLNRGKCGKRCAEGSQSFQLPGDVSYVVDYLEMDDRGDVVTECPSPLAGTVRLYCQDGKVLARENECRQARPCAAGDFLLGHALLQHTAMDHGIMEMGRCPEGFEGELRRRVHLCPACAELPPDPPTLGVSARYLLDFFPPLAQRSTGMDNPNFYEICPHLAHGPNGMGYAMTCPRDGRPHCSLVDALDDEHSGKATHFLSWCWAYQLQDVVTAVHRWLRKSSEWSTGSDDLKDIFEGHLVEAGRMLVLLDKITIAILSNAVKDLDVSYARAGSKQDEAGAATVLKYRWI
eukprot:Skav202410  [mRNA]  locus=scaffold815:528710:541726:+ [translate_table: standard]